MNSVDSKRHFLISLAIGVAVVALTNAPYPDLVVVAYAAVLGVAIDFDHFLTSRFHRGDWKAVQRCFENPTIVFLDQSAIFDDDDLWAHQRLLSHVVIIGAFLPVVYFLAGPFLTVVSAVVLYAHVLADLIADNRNHEQFLQTAARIGATEEREMDAEPPVQ